MFPPLLSRVKFKEPFSKLLLVVMSSATRLKGDRTPALGLLQGKAVFVDAS